MDPTDPEPLYRLPSYDHATAQGVWLLAFSGLLVDVAASLLAGASALAQRWHHLSVLGRPWLRYPSYPEPRLLLGALGATAALVLLAVRMLAAALRRDGSASRHLNPPKAFACVAPFALPALVVTYLAALGPLYPLPALLRWSARYERVPALAGDIAQARAATFGTLIVFLAVTFAAAAAQLSRLRETGDTHGSSHWASPREVLATGLLGPPRRSRPRASRTRSRSATAPPPARPAEPAGGGLPVDVVEDRPVLATTGATKTDRQEESASPYAPLDPAESAAKPSRPVAAPASQTPAAGAAGAVVVGAWFGRAPGERRPRLHRLYDRRDRHVLVFAPSGSGKTTCLVIPTLLAWPHSVVALDVKGELWHLTAGYRQRVLGQTCLRLDLAAADGKAARYNPLLVVPRGPEDVKYAQNVADTLVDPDGRDQPRSFWDQSAHALLTATILHVLYAGRDKNLGGCARLLADPGRPLRQTLEQLLVAPHDPGFERGWREPASGNLTATHPVVAATARSLLDLDLRTTSGVVATAQAFLSLFRDPILDANTAASDFFPADLVAGERPVSLYLTLSPADLNRLRGPVRILLNQLCRSLTERLDFEPASARPVHRHPLLLLLDEFPILGRLDFFGRAMAYLRGYGIRVYISLQSLAQLYEIYGQHQSITANCAVQVAFAPADVETAELLSRMTGPMTVHVAKRALANAPLNLGPRRHTLSLHELARPLLTAEEVRRLPDREALVFAAGHPPIRGRRVPYYSDPELVRRCRMAAPEESDRIAQPAGGWPEGESGAGGGQGAPGRDLSAELELIIEDPPIL
ncbi:MAG TPA: type IV secretory system conjugative DNA transfer family protein [Thermoanaerobaculia bacterium]|nr:type IV secretory system conjugative DNA transfer family protein [Thermoanaerobaculia bacterium]